MRENSIGTMIILAMLAVFLSACTGQAAAALETDIRVAAGERLFTVYCSACHSTVPDAVVVGPSLAGIASRAETRIAGMDARSYIQQSIVDPQAYLVESYKNFMPPNFADTLENDEIEALIAYLFTLE